MVSSAGANAGEVGDTFGMINGVEILLDKSKNLNGEDISKCGCIICLERLRLGVMKLLADEEEKKNSTKSADLWKRIYMVSGHVLPTARMRTARSLG